MIRVLIVDDSRVERELLKRIIESNDNMKVIATVGDGEAALEAVRRLRPDIVTMDIHMPKLDGIEATREIMHHCPVPIIIVTNSYETETAKHTFRAIEEGALVVVKKPVGIGHADFEKESKYLLKTIRLMSEIKVIRRIYDHSRLLQQGRPVEPPMRTSSEIEVIAIGASTGGPAVIARILTDISKTQAPLLIVQHMTPGFTESFVTWLRQTTGYPVILAKDGEQLRSGAAYVAPDDCHMVVTQKNKISLLKEFAKQNLKPSVDVLFDSVAQHYGSSAVGILLTGMGRDGAAGLAKIQLHGGITIAQGKESAVVFGMPGEAIKLGAAQHILDPKGIVDFIESLI